MKFHATGAGQAVVQLDVNYGIDYEPNKDKPPKVKRCSNYQMTAFEPILKHFLDAIASLDWGMRVSK